MRAEAPFIVSSITLLWAAALPLCTCLQSPATTTAARQQRSTTTSSSSFQIQSGTWKFREQEHPIAYEYVVCAGNDDTTSNSAPVLLLNGFGMGTFHQHRLMRALHDQLSSSSQPQESGCPAGSGRWRGGGTVVYAMDYLGQGQSWPRDCNDGQADSERGLRYCGNTWVEQIIQFVEQHMLSQPSQSSPHKVHLVGNSVGGHLAAFCAAARPDLIETVTLLNATPVWGLNLPGWSGRLPAPPLSRLAGRVLFDAMRHPDTIRQFLDRTYANGAAWQPTPLARQVRSCTEGPGGHAAFASILWSPPVTVPLKLSGTGNDDNNNRNLAAAEEASFYDCLEHGVQCDVLLCFGRDDPWCKPAFAKRMLQRLQARQQSTSSSSSTTQRYVELSNVGHCPNHESPTATAQILAAWLGAANGRRPEQLSLLPKGGESSVAVREEWGETVVRELKADEIPLSWADRLAVQFL